MSTNLNDVVAELYRELQIRYEKKPVPVSKFKKLCRAPMHMFHQLWKRMRFPLHGYGAAFVKDMPVYAAGFNKFQPTDKVFPDIKIAVYSAITGGYDNIKTPIYIDDTLDYYLFTDAPASGTSEIMQTSGERCSFTMLPVPEHLTGLSSAKKNRYIKLHPDEVLSESITGKKYDYTVYIDGSIRITCDIKPLVYSLVESGKNIAIHTHFVRDCLFDEAKICYFGGKADWNSLTEQMNAYRREGMPRHFGLAENSVIIRKCNDPELQHIMHEWWLQIKRYTHRDQLSLPYVLWKNGLDMSYIFSLGTNVWKNPYFLFSRHN